MIQCSRRSDYEQRKIYKLVKLKHSLNNYKSSNTITINYSRVLLKLGLRISFINLSLKRSG